MSEPDLERLTRLLGGREPVAAKGAIIVPRRSTPYFAGTTLPVVSDLPAMLRQEQSGILVPAAAGLPGTPAYMKAFIGLSEYTDMDPAEMATGIIHGFSRQDLLMALAYLNHCLLHPKHLKREEEEFRARLPETAREAYQKRMEDTGMSRVFLSRQAVLLAMKRVLRQGTASTTWQSVPLIHAAIVLCHAIADSLDDPDFSEGAELWNGMPVAAAMEVVQNYAFHMSEDFFQRIGRTLLLWNRYGAADTRNALSKPAAELFRDATGFFVEDFMAMGFGLWAPLSAWAPGKPLMGQLREGIGLDAASVDRFLGLIARDVGTFATDLTDGGPWDFVQFEKTPVVLLDGGQLGLDETFLERRLTSGLFWDVHDAQRAHGGRERQAWTGAYGEFVEKMALDRLEAIAPPVLGTGRRAIVTEDEISQVLPGKHCDAIVDEGSLVGAFEIVSGNLTVATRQAGNLEAFQRDTVKLVLEKAEQLNPVVDSLRRTPEPLLGRSSTPEVVAVCVEGGGYPLNPVTAAYIADRLSKDGLFPVHGVVAPGIIDIAELEILQGLREKLGVATVGVLRDWIVSTGRGYSFRNYLLERFHDDQDGFRPEDIRAVVEPFLDEIVDRLQVPKPAIDESLDRVLPIIQPAMDSLPDV